MTLLLFLAMPGLTEWIPVVLVWVLIMLIPKIIYLISLKSTFDTISRENRTMSPENVWLLLIPIFGLVWHFFIVNNLSISIKKETDLNRITIYESKPAYDIGIAMCILDCLLLIPLLNLLIFIPSIICWILYWKKINSYKNILLTAKYNAVGSNR